MTPGLQQRDRRLVTEALDIERAASGDVKHPLPQLRWTRPSVRTADVGVALLGRCQRGATLGTRCGHFEFAFGAVAQIDHGTEHLGNHVAGLADHYGVTDQHALAFDL